MAHQPDPVLRLLWRHGLDEPPAPRRGRKQSLTVDDVVDAAIKIADRDGLDALTMRLLATELGIGAMSLYTYVPGRKELLALMADQVFRRRTLPPMPADLRERLALIARTHYEICREHPWMPDVMALQNGIGPGVSDLYEWQLSGIEDIGLDDLEMDQTVAVLIGFAGNIARSQERMRQAERESGMSEAEWWEANAAELGTLMAGREYPIAARVGAAAGTAYQASADPSAELEFGLARIIDGVVAYVDRRS
ncbi:TetR/AcrR family transcriptional regulator [Myceligenerans pegani]|uniref:TetR/AcrR family transcriptional regulator n=1 Tax=Myceligenerans pegani TaxID=2776917 RepID=A0ABR9MXC7_9MICO|nr:TetR/AcrR family transcriptional regulator [Myceligenerans sp. TRM 65318]MBE1876044.1 TetR/AcrR family transcriptional regulator [Myceligenerans sp. TRM 65318]MBE3018315.1 TetR/AcrR family transcriptional regulator [Myceligenerans sp. TRM 65318]